jgi:hypothetical protein
MARNTGGWQEILADKQELVADSRKLVADKKQ